MDSGVHHDAFTMTRWQLIAPLIVGLIFFVAMLWMAGSTRTIYFDDAPRVEAGQ
jgi:hypothetical protein